MTTRRKLILTSLSLLVLGGCAVTDSESLFSAAGRFSVIVRAANGQQESFNGRFSLRRTATLTTLDLMTPLNGILARIEVTPSGATLMRNPDEEPLRAPTAEALMERALGFSLPPDALEDWLRMTQDQAEGWGWQVTVSERLANGLPKRIRAKRQTSEVALSLTLLLDD